MIPRSSVWQRLLYIVFVLAVVFGWNSFYCEEAQATPMTQARTMHIRIASVPPSPAVQSQMAAQIQGGNPEAAAALAMQSPYFYNVTMKNFVKPLTNEDEQVLVPLNDMVATVVGMVRDDVPFDQVLYGDILYTGSDAVVAANANIDSYSPSSNDHYDDLESARIDLSDANNLVQRVQSDMNGITDTAGIMTTRAYGEAFLNMGTNRAAVRWAFLNFLCNDMEQLSDVTIPDFHVRRDVDRSPGGSSATYVGTCKGCHAGMDSLGGAFAFIDYQNGEVVETAGTVAPKINAIVNFTAGWQTTDNSWLNLWTAGQNARLEWASNVPTNGNGIRSFGRMLAATGEFRRCMAKRVFKQVCMREPVLDPSAANSEVARIQALANRFGASNYNMKTLVGATASGCMGD